MQCVYGKASVRWAEYELCDYGHMMFGFLRLRPVYGLSYLDYWFEYLVFFIFGQRIYGLLV